MPDKPLTVATYAVGASLAAATLVYVFAPTFFIDQEAETNANSRKRGVVGLTNPANDCFINSTVQALAGLSDLRLYLIRETHRRDLDGPAYRNLVEDPNRDIPEWKIEGLQQGIVTKGLKDLLDALNERPLYRKTISAAQFVKCLEAAFRQRISRQQQDAQEFLQIVAERLNDEYNAGRRARQRAREIDAGPVDNIALQRELSRLTVDAGADGQEENAADTTTEPSQKQPAQAEAGISVTAATPSVRSNRSQSSSSDEIEEGFPMEGSFESQIECLTCGFKPAPNRSTFCSLTLNVPASTGGTTLGACFDGIFKTEYIEDFRCEKCSLIYAVEVYERNLSKSTDQQQTTKIKNSIGNIRKAIETDPESEGLELPDMKDAPRRKIARHIKIVSFPNILSIHLSRSIYDHRSSIKNAAKVDFPEILPLGGLLNQHKYKISSVVTHKGSHHSGHYETFRRQNTPQPFANKNTFKPAEEYSKSGTPGTSIATTPQLKAVLKENNPAMGATPELLSPTRQNPSSSKVSLSGSSSPPRTADNSRPRTASIISRSSSSSGSKKDGTSSPTRGLRVRTRSSLSQLKNNISRTLSRSPTKDSNSGSSSPTGTASPTLGTTTTISTGFNTLNTSTATDAGNDGNSINLKKMHQKRRQKKTLERWWRISDEKVKESKTSEVLGMQREVYLLFYELQRER